MFIIIIIIISSNCTLSFVLSFEPKSPHLSTKTIINQNTSGKKKLILQKIFYRCFHVTFVSLLWTGGSPTTVVNFLLPLLPILNLVLSLLSMIPACLTIYKYGKFIMSMLLNILTNGKHNNKRLIPISTYMVHNILNLRVYYIILSVR